MLNFLGATGAIHASDSPTETLVASNRDGGELGFFFIKTVSIDGAATTAAMILRVSIFCVNLDLWLFTVDRCNRFPGSYVPGDDFNSCA